MWKVYGQTSPGMVRPKNQDCWVDKTLLGKNGSILLCGVADGMGGHLAGDVASRIAVSELSQQLSNMAMAGDLSEALRQAFFAANEKVYQESLDKEQCSGMGTTLTAALLAGKDLFLCHVGDSRAYLYSRGELKRLTRDHSIVEELIERGELTPVEAELHPQRHFLTRAIGIGASLKLDCSKADMEFDDILLLCTDGLTRLVSDVELAEVVARFPNPDEAVKALVGLSMERGAPDNVTVVLVVWKGDVQQC